jgi:DNA repair protein SbcC/Rad50
MLSSLKYEATFSPTGPTLSKQLAFSTGLTLITGPNESGKTFSMEMLRYCLFGSAALRGSVSDFASLRTDLTFTVRGQEYTVKRTLNHAQLLQDGEVITTGTKPVNQKITELFGYDLPVFDVANAFKQGEGSRLSDMRPTERRRMVDRLVGADRLEQVSQWCQTQARDAQVALRAVQGVLVPPVPPEPLETAVDPDELPEVRALESELSFVEATLRALPQSDGSVPPTEQEIADYEHGVLEKERLARLPLIDFDRDELRHAWRAYEAHQRQLALGPKASMREKEVDALLQEWDAYTANQALVRQYETLSRSPVVTCECGKQFSLAQSELDDLKARIRDIQQPATTVAELRQQKQRHERWRGQPIISEAPKPDRPASLIDAVGTSVEERAKWRGFDRQELARLKDQSLRRMGPELEAKRDWLNDQLGGRSSEEILRQVYALETYTKAVEQYEKDLSIYNTRLEEQATREADAADWAASRTAVDALRQEVKLHLIPSLARVASGLMTQLTGGSRNRIEIDDQFEITVDGRPIHALSGSGKDCANIALRLALGQVLTNNTFSVLILDEADTAMDANRAENLQSTLKALSTNISQIILVTHKVPHSEHVIAMGT